MHTKLRHKTLHKVVDGKFCQQCAKCKEWLPVDEKYFIRRRGYSKRLNTICRGCERARNRNYQNNNRHRWREKQRLSGKRWHLRKLYSLSYDDYLKLLDEHNWQCDICHESKRDNPSNLVIDHDHVCCSSVVSCGKCIRGVLCRRCNSGLGFFDERFELIFEAAKYLQKCGC